MGVKRTTFIGIDLEDNKMWVEYYDDEGDLCTSDFELRGVRVINSILNPINNLIYAIINIIEDSR